MISGLYFSGDKRKHILVTGASGSIGKELVRYLKAQPDTDVLTLNSGTGERIDLKDREQIKGLLRKQPLDSIYHLAALNPFKSNQGADYFDINAQGTENLLEGVLALKKQGQSMPNVFLASTALVYTPDKIPLVSWQPQNPVQESDLDATLENARQKLAVLNPADGQVAETLLGVLNLSKDEIYYNDSKLLAEMTAQAYARKGVPVKTGRLVNCYGKQSDGALMNQLLAESRSGKEPSLDGKDTLARDYLFFDGESSRDDVLRMAQAIADKGKPGEAYNISSSGRFVRSPQAIAENVRHSKAGAADTSNPAVLLSNQKLLALGVKAPQTSPEEGIRILRQNSTSSGIKGFWHRVKNWFHQAFERIKQGFRKLFGQKSKPKPEPAAA